MRQKFEAVPREYKESLLSPSDTQWRYNKYLTNLVFSVRTASYTSSFFPFDLWPKRFALGPEIEEEKTQSVTNGSALELG